jgi:hypothetical protein
MHVCTRAVVSDGCDSVADEGQVASDYADSVCTEHACMCACVRVFVCLYVCMYVHMCGIHGADVLASQMVYVCMYACMYASISI